MDFDAVFQRLYPALFRYLHRLTGDADLAEDIAQEAFVRMLVQPLPEEQARPWLFTVATNLVRDSARKAVRRDRLLAGVRLSMSSARGPDEELEVAEQVQAVRSVLERLPPRDQQLLLMREEGFKYEEMAQVVGVAAGSIGTLLARALRRFTELYGEREDAPDAR